MRTPLFVAILMTAIFVAPAASAGHKSNQHNNGRFYDQAQVVDVEPIRRTVHISAPEPRCSQEEVHYPATHADAVDAARNVFVGGIVGGIIGHQFGKGRGKDAATLAGTLIGASIAHDRAKRSVHTAQYDRVVYEQRCHIVDQRRTEERIDGYWVTYLYQGQTFTTRLPYDPGSNIRVRVRVSVVRN